MSEPFLGEIRMVGFNFAPLGWAFCDGQILPIHQNQPLYSLLGTIYGGDGRTSFALPDLRGRTPVHKTDGYNLGQKGGEETVVLNLNTMPEHSHGVNATSAPAYISRADSTTMLASPDYAQVYGDLSSSNKVSLQTSMVGSTGQGQAHNNMQPFLTLNYCIALQGLFPSRN